MTISLASARLARRIACENRAKIKDTHVWLFTYGSESWTWTNSLELPRTWTRAQALEHWLATLDLDAGYLMIKNLARLFLPNFKWLDRSIIPLMCTDHHLFFRMMWAWMMRLMDDEVSVPVGILSHRPANAVLSYWTPDHSLQIIGNVLDDLTTRTYHFKFVPTAFPLGFT